MSEPKPTMVVGPVNYVPTNNRDEYSVSVELINCDPAKCRMIVTMEKELLTRDASGVSKRIKEFAMEELVDLKTKVDLTLYDATTFHIYLFCGDVSMLDNKQYYPTLQKKFKHMRDFCKSADSDCTVTKETINVILTGGRRRKSHPRSSGSRRSGSKRSGSKRSGGSRRRHGGSRRRR